MSLQIMTNTLANNAQRHLEQTSQRLHSVLEKLSSGSRINHASDDAAGLAISDSLNADIRSLGQAIRNSQDGISLIQIFESGTTEINNMLMRIRELAMQASSDTVGDRERTMLNNEVIQLKDEVQRVAMTTSFAGAPLLSGEVTEMEFQVGIHNVDEVDRIMFSPGDTNLTADALNIGSIEITDKDDAQGSLEILDEALFRVNDVRARVGSVQSRLNVTVQAQGVYQENLSAARSRIRDADLAVESSNLAREAILRKAGVAVLTQANETPAVALQLIRG